jgi:hypothetical protein
MSVSRLLRWPFPLTRLPAPLYRNRSGVVWVGEVIQLRGAAGVVDHFSFLDGLEADDERIRLTISVEMDKVLRR